MKKKLLKLLGILNISYTIVFLIKSNKFINNLLLRYGWSDYSYAYFKKVYDRFVQDLNSNGIKIENKSILEIGSGNLPALGYFFLTQNGAKHYCASDPHRKGNLSTSENLKKQKEINQCFKKNNISLEQYVSVDNKKLIFNENSLLFERYDITSKDFNCERKYDLILSNAVLEHIKKDYMNIAIVNMAKLLNEGGYMIHEIDFRDHIYLDRPLNNLRFSEDKWNEITADSIFYTNRLKLSQFIELFKKSNFEIIYINKQLLDSNHTKGVIIHSDISGLPASDFLLYSVRIIVKKVI